MGHATTSQVREGDVVTIALKHVVIGTDLHVPFQIPDLLSNRIQAAIVANAFQMCSDASCNDGFNFKPDADNDGRVVYFSNDIKKSQRSLSFGTLPMFGPFEYNGNPVGISLHVVKLANDQSASLAPMLTALSSIGLQSGLPTEVSSVLNTMGSNLLKGFEVRLLRYDTLLMQGGSANDRSLGISRFVYGDYIVIRTEERSQEINFGDLRYDPATARLYRDVACTPAHEVSDVTYGVIQVLRGNRSAYIKAANLANLRKQVDDFANSRMANLPSQVLAKLARDTAFELDLKRVRAATQLGLSGNVIEKEALYAILKKMEASTAGTRNMQAERYNDAEVDSLLNALMVAIGQNFSRPLSAEMIFNNIKSAWSN